MFYFNLFLWSVDFWLLISIRAHLKRSSKKRGNQHKSLKRGRHTLPSTPYLRGTVFIKLGFFSKSKSTVISIAYVREMLLKKTANVVEICSKKLKNVQEAK